MIKKNSSRVLLLLSTEIGILKKFIKLHAGYLQNRFVKKKFITGIGINRKILK